MRETWDRFLGWEDPMKKGKATGSTILALENSMDYTAHGVVKSQTWLRDFHFTSLQFIHSAMSESLQPHELQHTRPPCPLPTPGVCPNSYPLSWWCHPTISFSAVPFSSCPQSFPASGSFPMSQFFTSGGQSIGVSALASVLNEYSRLISFRIDWFDLVEI